MCLWTAVMHLVFVLQHKFSDDDDDVRHCVGVDLTDTTCRLRRT